LLHPDDDLSNSVKPHTIFNKKKISSKFLLSFKKYNIQFPNQNYTNTPTYPGSQEHPDFGGTE
jgi:hypothetical protein